MIEQEAKLSLG